MCGVPKMKLKETKWKHQDFFHFVRLLLQKEPYALHAVDENLSQQESEAEKEVYNETYK